MLLCETDSRNTCIVDQRSGLIINATSVRIWPPTNFNEHGQCCTKRVKMFTHVCHQLMQVSSNRKGLKFAFATVNVSIAPLRDKNNSPSYAIKHEAQY